MKKKMIQLSMPQLQDNEKIKEEKWLSKLLIVTEPKTIQFDLPKNVGKNLKHEIGFSIKHNEVSTDHKIKKKISQLFFKYNHGNDIYGHTHTHTNNELTSQIFFFKLSYRLGLKISKKHVAP